MAGKHVVFLLYRIGGEKLNAFSKEGIRGEDAVVFEICLYFGAMIFIIEFQGLLWYGESLKYGPIGTT